MNYTLAVTWAGQVGQQRNKEWKGITTYNDDEYERNTSNVEIFETIERWGSNNMTRMWNSEIMKVVRESKKIPTL